MLERKISRYLEEWLANIDNRKPLFIKGARQVGKSTTIKLFAKKNFKKNKIIYLDLQNNMEAYKYVKDTDIDAETFINALETIFRIKIDDSCILIIDEIQRLPHLETLLKPLSEQYSGLPIIASGSLIDLILHNATNSKPVGKIETIYMYPLNFEEFCLNTKYNYYLKIIKTHIKNENFNSIDKIVHDKMNEHYYNYLIVGGMPEAVMSFSEGKINYTKIKENLLDDYRDDISKFFDVRENNKIRSIYDSIFKQLIKGNTRFQFKSLNLDNIKKVDRYSRIKNSTNSLILSNMIGMVNYIDVLVDPLISREKDSFFKLYFNDVGFFSTHANLNYFQIKTKMQKWENIKGGLTENYVYTQIRFNPTTWKSIEVYTYDKDRVEIDFILEGNHVNNVVIEVKSSANKKSISFKRFIDNQRKNDKKIVAIKTSPTNFAYDKANQIYHVPLYAIGLFINHLREQEIL